MPNARLLQDVQTFNNDEGQGQVTSAQLAGTPLVAEEQQSDSSIPLELEFPPNIPAIPPKTVKKILAGEYVDMAELRPDSWRMEELLYLHSAGDTTNNVRTRRKPVTDILTWTECFSSMAAVITLKYPDKAPGMFSYQRTIISASQNFDAAAWVTYDCRFRRKVAATKSFDWAAIDSSLYSECFAGRAKAKPTCNICLSESHLARSCPISMTTPNINVVGGAGFGAGSGSGPSGFGQPTTRWPNWSWTGNKGAASQKPKEICGLFNRQSGNECTYAVCKFAHICSLCRQGPHPASQCNRPRRSLLSTPQEYYY